MGDTRYVTLMASLPYHGRLFGARQTPLSRFQLNKRLAWLQPDDAETLRRIEDVLRWRRLLMRETDAEFLKRARDVISSLDNTLLTEIVQTRLEARTLTAALRMRNAGQAPPKSGQRWGFGRWVEVIARHWSDTDFGLGRVFPWVTDADEKLRQNDVVGVERLFMGFAWWQLSRLGAGHYFDFEAVAVYVLRWDLIDRWTHYEPAGARRRVLELAEAGLGTYRRIYA